jgi:hypothetical protein
MKALLKAHISNIDKVTSNNGQVTFRISGNGKTETVVGQTTSHSQEVILMGDLILKAVTADQLKIGTTFYITISDSSEE